jgi:hypothetical protein
MAKHASDQNSKVEEKETYTKEDVQKMLAEERKNQFLADETRIHGNAFFAEALDHIGTLAARDPFWRKVHQFGNMFKNQFQINTGQAAPTPQQAASPAAKEKPVKKPAVEETTTEDTTGDEERQG